MTLTSGFAPSTAPGHAGGRIRFGLLLIGDGQWRGGLNYQRTLLETIASTLSDKIEALVFVTQDQRALAEETFGKFLEQPPVVDARVAGAGAGWRAVRALVTGCDRPFEALMREHDVDVVFESARYFGRSFSLPTLCWLPDFQHLYLPDLFPRLGWWKREIGFRAQTRTNKTRLVMLSSETARADCERFYPASLGHTRVVRFAPEIAIDEARARVAGAKSDHSLPDRFFYLPNHFWTHKNHAVVLEALRRLRDEGRLEGLPPVVMSGPTNDYRNAGLFNNMMAEAQADGLAPWFRHLGLIPFGDVLALNAGALSLLNPSKFEGWASSVEEAKALGTPMILSDIPVHREQAPRARFFAPCDAAALARMLHAAAHEPAPAPPQIDSLKAAANRRLSGFSAALETALLDAYALGGTN